jgi:3-carboxy-cis,cis-muconate cycloisomerase
LALLDTRLGVMTNVLSDLDNRYGDSRLMARTRMQAAIEITVANRIESWRAPLLRHREHLADIRQRCLAVQFGGAAGTLERLGDDGPAVRAALAERLGLADAPQWHSQRDRIVEIADWLSLVTGSLGKIGLDIALMAQAGDEIELAGGGASSAMPHKQNPVAAETLVALARFNATQVAGVHHALLHEQERSGAAWTLEWLLLPPMVCACASSLRLGVELGSDIRRLGSA